MKGLDEDECSVKPVPFTVQYIKCVFFPPLFFFTAYGFSFHNRGERSCSEDDVCARVGWALRIDQLYVFLMFPLRGHSFRRHSPQIYFFPAHPLQPVLCFLSLLDLLLTSSFSFSPLFLMFFLHIFLLPLPLSLPQRSPGSPVVCLLEGIPTPPPPPLEPRSFLPRSLAFPLSPFLKKIFFSSSLFNVEVLSNCWLLLWFGGNGIFRRMPHAMASIHS